LAISDLLEKLSGASDSDAPDLEPDDTGDPAPGEVLEPDDLLDPDPAPVKRTRKRSAGSSAPRVTAGQKKTVTEAWEAMIMLPAGLAAIRDPVCGGAALDQAKTLAEALTKVTCRNPAMLAWFLSDGAPYMDWIAVFMAARPIATTIWAHHVSHAIGGKEDEGAPDFSTAYPAPVFSG
jgi:hypothetical protein